MINNNGQHAFMYACMFSNEEESYGYLNFLLKYEPNLKIFDRNGGTCLSYLQKLCNNKLIIKKVGGDGNCLFRTISDQLYGT